MVAIIPTTGAQVIKTPQLVEEGYPATAADYGVMPSTPTFTPIGYNTQVEPSQDVDLQEVDAVGYEDVQAYLAGKEADMAKVTFNPVDSNLIKRACNSVNWTSPAGTEAATFQLLYSVRMNDVENFVVLGGCRVNTLKLSLTAGSPLKADAEVWGQLLAGYTSSGPSGATYATPVSGAPWNYADGGATPVTIGGTNVVVTDIEADISRNLKRLFVLGSTHNIDLPPTTREISGKMTVVWSNATQQTALEALTEQTMVWTLKSSVSTATFSNMAFSKLDSLTAGPKDVIYEKYSWKAMTLAVT